MKKGKGEEQAQAAFCLVLLCVQMGAGDESEELFKQLRSTLTTIMTDSSASLKARGAVSRSSHQKSDIIEEIIAVPHKEETYTRVTGISVFDGFMRIKVDVLFTAW